MSGCQAPRALELTNGINLQGYLAIKYLRQGILEKSFLAKEVLELIGKSLLTQKPSQRIQPMHVMTNLQGNIKKTLGNL